MVVLAGELEDDAEFPDIQCDCQPSGIHTLIEASFPLRTSEYCGDSNRNFHVPNCLLTPSSTINVMDLPDELLCLILGELDLRAACKAGQTCKHLRDLRDDTGSGVWKRIMQKRFPSKVWDDFVPPDPDQLDFPPTDEHGRPWNVWQTAVKHYYRNTFQYELKQRRNRVRYAKRVGVELRDVLKKFLAYELPSVVCWLCLLLFVFLLPAYLSGYGVPLVASLVPLFVGVSLCVWMLLPTIIQWKYFSHVNLSNWVQRSMFYNLMLDCVEVLVTLTMLVMSARSVADGGTPFPLWAILLPIMLITLQWMVILTMAFFRHPSALFVLIVAQICGLLVSGILISLREASVLFHTYSVLFIPAWMAYCFPLVYAGVAALVRCAKHVNSEHVMIPAYDFLFTAPIGVFHVVIVVVNLDGGSTLFFPAFVPLMLQVIVVLSVWTIGVVKWGRLRSVCVKRAHATTVRDLSYV